MWIFEFIWTFVFFVSIFSYDREETELILDNEKHLIKLHDTAGQEDYERLRQVVYKEVSLM